MGAVALAALAGLLLAAPVAHAAFGFKGGATGFAVRALADDNGSTVGGTPASQAASHPYKLDVHVAFNQVGSFNGQVGPFPDGDLRNLRIEMPPGMLLNPNAPVKCAAADFNTPRGVTAFATSRSGESCPDESQVGTLEVQTSFGGGQPWRFGLFNLVPAPGVPAQLGASPFGSPVVLDVNLRQDSSGQYALTLEATNFPQALDVSGLDLALWGTPGATSHNGERGDCLNEFEPEFPWAKCAVSSAPAFLTLPTQCLGSLSFNAFATAWQQSAGVSAAAVNRDSLNAVVPIGDCGSVTFNPGPSADLTTQKASSASGYRFQLTNDNNGLTVRGQRIPSPAKTAVVALPPGVTINPSVGAGLGVCTPGQYGAETAFNAQGNGCPNGAKIGDFRVRSPIFDDWLEGAIYLAQPNHPATPAPGAENPFDSLIAVYLIAKLPARGVLVKVAGRIAADPGTGNLTGVFDGLPQLPYTDLQVNFRPGQRSFLISPAFCGSAVTGIQMSPWSGGAAANANSSSPITAGVDFGPCPPPAAAQPFAPDAVTGAFNSNVGSYTPYFVHMVRHDTDQEITSYSLELPKGVTGKLAGIPFCPEAAIEAARHRLGVDETANPSCPGASQVGRTLTGYGVGAALTYAPGRVYLAGPHNGRPLSLVTINAATVGPFDLGTIVVRSAFAVDTHTAQLQIDSSASDPIPHILDGIPLHLRDVRVYMDRFQFTHNPSSCEPSALVSTLTGSGATFSNPADDSSVTISRHFQLLNCRTLDFRPKLGMRLRGSPKRGGYPSLRATFASRGAKDSNLRRIEVTTPQALFLAQNHIRTVCTRAQFADRRCPAGSIYGKAVAYTPLFDAPLRGKVYLRSSSNRLPDLVADLYSGAIRIVVEGRIGPGRRGGIRTFFDNLPDAPIDRFVMTLRGGRRGLLQNSSNICVQPPLATVSAIGQNNIGARFNTKLRGQCKKRKKHRKRRGHTRRKPGEKGKKSALASARRSVR